jgi:hypothetical protein
MAAIGQLGVPWVAIPKKYKKDAFGGRLNVELFSRLKV